MLTVATTLLLGCASSPRPASVAATGATDASAEAAQPHFAEPEFAQRYGFRVEGVRLASAGYMLDFRYRIADADRAWEFLRSAEDARLTTPEGAVLIVPRPAYIGPLSQSSEKPKENRTYFIFFANPGRHVAEGDEVTVHLGDVEVGPLTVKR